MAGCRCDWLRPAVCPSLKGRLVAFQGAHQARRGRLVVVGADKAKARSIATSYRPPSQEEASLRAEAEAPFRSLRLVLFGASTVSAVLATLFGLPSLIGALGHAPNAKPLLEAVQDLGINVAALGACGFVTKRDWDARERQIARLMREDQLGACQIELANGRVLRLAQLRGFARVVLLAGSEEQVASYLAASEPYREALQERGVMVVPLPFNAASSSEGGEGGGAVPPLGVDDLRWRAKAIRLDEWRVWFEKQAQLAGKTTIDGLYVSLRLDGRVRGSGVGCAPWPRMAAQLPPVEGFFGGLLDGMDGRV